MRPAQVVVVIPVKPPSEAKSRLGPVLEPSERMTLARNLLWRALKVVQGVDVREAWVVGGDPPVQQAAQTAGAIWMPEEGADLNEIVERAFQKVLDTGMAPLYIPADLPFLQTEDLSWLIQSVGNLTQVALAPDRLGTGTNAILLAEPSPFRPALGEGSFQKHLAQVASLEVRPTICYSPGLAWDLDTPEDLALYEAHSPGLTAELTGQPRPRPRTHQTTGTLYGGAGGEAPAGGLGVSPR